MPNTLIKQSKHLVLMGIALFITYLTVALPLSAVSVHVSKNLGLNNTLSGLAVGITFASTIFTRKMAGTFADTKGSKTCTMWGIFIYMVAAGICLLSALSALPTHLAYTLLLSGRLALGVGESFALVGIITWNITLVGVEHSGKVLAVVGMAIYGSLSVGGPLGLAIYNQFGFKVLMLVASALPCLSYLLLRPFAGTPKKIIKSTESFFSVLKRIWRMGTVVSLQGVGFAILSAFIPLYFMSKGWPYAGYGLTCFGVGFVLVRIFLGHLPDKIGGTKVAMVALSVEALGQYLLWFAPNVWVALAGAFFTGLGCSMVYPAMGVEVVRRIPPALRGTALGAFAAFQDLAYATAGPIAGILADAYNYPSIFLMGGIAATIAIAVAFSIREYE